MAPVTPVQPVTNQEFEDEGSWSQSDCDLSDSTGGLLMSPQVSLVSLPKMPLILRIASSTIDTRPSKV